MSHPWRNELRLELRTNGCFAELRRPGWRRSVVATASAAGRGAAALTAAIGALRLAQTQLHATDVRLVIADEYVDFALFDPEPRAARVRRQAAAQFAAARGHDDLRVQALALPGAGWLAAAIDNTDHAAWTEALRSAGLRLRHVHPALVEDLRRLAERIPEDDALLVLLREEGATLLRLAGGVPATLAWERFDPANRSALDARLRAFARHTGAADRATVVYMLPPSRALCRFVWEGSELPPGAPLAPAWPPARARGAAAALPLAARAPA